MMQPKPRYANEYPADGITRVERTLLFLAAKLGDLMEDIVVVGGLAPYLLIDQAARVGMDRHIGTMDLDLGLSVTLLDEEGYRRISERLRAEGFRPELTETGAIRRQTWCGPGPDQVTVDFLIPTNAQGCAAGKLTQLEPDFAAVTVNGLELAFISRERICVTETLPNGSSLSREVWVCSPAVFIMLKAHAFHLRTANKDAYDLFYLLREGERDELAAEYRRLMIASPAATMGLSYLRDDFVVHDAGGAQVAEFLMGRRDDAIEADVRGYVLQFIADVTGGH